MKDLEFLQIKYDRYGFIVAFTLFVILSMCFIGYSTDDIYISYRYAENMSNGYGLVFNKYEAPVEGYTNFLWTLMLAWAAWVRLPLPETATLFSIIFSASLILFMGVWANRQRHYQSFFPNSVPMIILASHPSLSLWSGTGMETPFFSWLIVLGSVVMSWEDRRWSSGGWISGFIWSLAALTRPEGILIGPMIIVLNFFESREFTRQKREVLLKRFTAFAVPVMWHFMWRKFFYGEWLPNTFYAKTGNHGELIYTGLTYSAHFLLEGGFLLLFLMILGLFVRPRICGIWTSLCTVLVYFMYVIWVGGDWMPGYRFFLPILPLMIMPASVFIVWLFHRDSRAGFITLSIVVAYMSLTGLLGQRAFIQNSLISTIKNGSPPVDVLVELGLHLREVAPSYAVIAVVPAGKVPYYSKLQSIDMRGLCDRHIAGTEIPKDIKHSLPGHLKRDPQYVLNLKPDYIILSGAIRKENLPPANLTLREGQFLDEWDIVKLPDFKECYKPVRVALPKSDKDLFYYRRICRE